MIAWVVFLKQHSNWEWQLNWRRHLFDSEIAMADSFLGDISQQQQEEMEVVNLGAGNEKKEEKVGTGLTTPNELA